MLVADIDGNADKSAPGGVSPAVVARLHASLQWLLRHHESEDISVAVVSVLTFARFEDDPIRDGGIAATLAQLRSAGVLVLANGGNCRGWWEKSAHEAIKPAPALTGAPLSGIIADVPCFTAPSYRHSCTGLPWPAIVHGVTPVGSASFGSASRHFDHEGAVTTSLEDASCERDTYAVCGAIFTSGALAVFAAGMVLLLEALARASSSREPAWWQHPGAGGGDQHHQLPENRVDAALAIVRATAVHLSPMSFKKVQGTSRLKTLGCPHRRSGLRLERALQFVYDRASTRTHVA